MSPFYFRNDANTYMQGCLALYAAFVVVTLFFMKCLVLHGGHNCTL